MRFSELLQEAANQAKEQEEVIEFLSNRCDMLESRNKQLTGKLKELGGILYSAASIFENIDNTY